jgi:endo-alpha-1,4-polygalactosaminidase (GH114 family)
MADSKLLPAYNWSGYFLDDVNGDPYFRARAESPCKDFERKSWEFFENKLAVLAAISEAKGTSFLVIPTKGRNCRNDGD